MNIKFFIIFLKDLLKFLYDNLFTRLSKFSFVSGIVVFIFSSFLNPLSYNEAFLFYGYLIIAVLYYITESLKSLLRKNHEGKSLLFNEIERIILNLKK